MKVSKKLPAPRREVRDRKKMVVGDSPFPPHDPWPEHPLGQYAETEAIRAATITDLNILPNNFGPTFR